MPALIFDPDALRRIRRAKGLRQLDLADALGCSLPTICRYETRGSVPDLAAIDQLATALGVDFMELTTRSSRQAVAA
ncbi:helix-turn-helix domain-containing protein [[Kitasatospora] papulosa]|uniref:helix-turn-helix domain-containing protein n=1 Tax=[Kitasatospora] papulosa TaxID=1464011 RepID=UPI00367AA21A